MMLDAGSIPSPLQKETEPSVPLRGTPVAKKREEGSVGVAKGVQDSSFINE